MHALRAIIPDVLAATRPTTPAALIERLEISEKINAGLWSGEPANDSAFTISPHLLDVFLSTGSRYIVLPGGRGSGKSRFAAQALAILARSYHLGVVLCCRTYENKLSSSVKPLLELVIEQAGWSDEFDIQVTLIRHKTTGTTFRFFGIAHDISQVKSMEGVSIVFLEETEDISEEQLQTIEATIRKAGARIVACYNPDQFLSFAHQHLTVGALQDRCLKFINFNQNLYLNREFLKATYAFYGRDPSQALHVFGGQALTSGSAACIPLKHALATIDAHIALGWSKEEAFGVNASTAAVGLDLNNGGADKCATVTRIGRVINGADEWPTSTGEMRGSLEKAFTTAARVGNGCRLTVDVCGIGADSLAHLDTLRDPEGNRVRIGGFNASLGVRDPDKPFVKFADGRFNTNKETFLNARAQAMLGDLAPLFRNTYLAVKYGVKMRPDQCISISGKIAKETLRQLMTEIAQPLKQQSNGKQKVESKDDMKNKRGLKSPNLLDALVMSVTPPNDTKAAAGFFG
ncbi:phage terminase large subunit [Paraburkholderia sp. EB58]|uniref:phage terminase large subunit n=1 Tax=Paraburkholderia sp. EB58 TaxID=3035125 RepID=UPI003D1E0F8A